ncbi:MULTISPECIES: M3 family metallopeptidase [unclassified Pedobacter]|uniref:M3 family metallopeptidase n=1 Tax=unclassified Pedobacter TaxID=2628915 RepID=UPI001423A784|nr:MULTISPECIES: M3 family metallopeptidase [unclassified Pedobacter]NII83401.1 peptidyl-dipeptidase Dcp [Pedobacter sp. SG908]NMN37267.1 peptidyl-dipeptidase Dcp [Pedobacter sp. SG918]
MKKVSYLPMLAFLAILGACNNKKNVEESESFSSVNPFFKASELAFQAPAFDKIKNSDFKPALEEGMKQQMDEIQKIADQTEAPSFENTILAIEKSGQLLSRTAMVFNLLTGANTNPELQKVKEEEAPKLTANSDAIYLNTKLFNRVQILYKQKDQLKLDAESLRLLEYYYQKFELAGAKLSDADKDKLKELNKEEATLSAKFTAQLQAAGKGLKNTTQQPELQSMTDRAKREELFNKSWNRAEKGDANDTRKIISRIAQIRSAQAALLGFKNYAAWKLQNQMAKTPEAVEDFFSKVIPAATAKAKSEAADIQAVIDQQKGGFKLEPWDWDFYAEQVRKAKFDLDENEVKPYFELNKVLINGVFYAATQLYGITFKERKDLPVYQEDVRVFDVIDKDGKQLGLFYCDYYKRDNKDGGAWMDNLVPQSKLFGTIPVIYNVCNFAKPEAGKPALISFDDVTTMFHEFGHGLHGLFANQQYPSLSGTSVARDYVEFPSQFNEHWASDPKILKNYALHYQTGAQMPQALLDKIKKASSFNQGYIFTEALAAADLDMQWHTISPGSPLQDVDKFEAEALKKTNLNLSYVPPRYRSSYFLHIWSNGYAAGYYAYSWTSMLENDAFSWFQENGGLTRANGQRFRDMILSKGNTEDLGKMFFNFRGHNPDIKPMLKKRGLL